MSLALVVDTNASNGPVGQDILPLLLTVEQVAKHLAVSSDWVYRHADDLGAVRLGGGAKPRLRFYASTVADYVHACSTGRRIPKPQIHSAEPDLRERGARSSNRATPLLPIRGQGPTTKGRQSNE
jgi:hypothetical protein